MAVSKTLRFLDACVIFYLSPHIFWTIENEFILLKADKTDRDTTFFRESGQAVPHSMSSLPKIYFMPTIR